MSAIRKHICHMLIASFSMCAAVQTAQAKPVAKFEYIGPEIRFEQVYNNPSNVELKLEYARQQAANGDLLSASAALEGLLFTSPNWDSARLFYAMLLVELDDYTAAAREFKILVTRPLNAEQLAMANAYLKMLDGQ